MNDNSKIFVTGHHSVFGSSLLHALQAQWHVPVHRNHLVREARIASHDHQE